MTIATPILFAAQKVEKRWHGPAGIATRIRRGYRGMVIAATNKPPKIAGRRMFTSSLSVPSHRGQNSMLSSFQRGNFETSLFAHAHTLPLPKLVLSFTWMVLSAKFAWMSDGQKSSVAATRHAGQEVGRLSGIVTQLE